MPGKTRLVQTTEEPVSSDDLMTFIKNTDRLIGPIDIPFHRQQIFNSFCVDEDRTTMGIKMPLRKNPYAVLSSLVLEYQEDPASGSKNVKKTTPEVRNSTLLSGIEMTPYEYSMYTYKIAPKPGQLSNDNRRWVFTGGGKLNIGLTTNTFIPVEQLQIRLNGTATQRRYAYALDWMTYLGHWSDMKGSEKPKIPGDFYNNLAKQVPNNSTAKKIFTGAHLELRNSVGELSDGSKFLGDLLAPTGGDPINDLSVFIFTRWCKVAYAACIAEPTAWSVKARFWAWPPDVLNGVTFVYAPPDDLWPNVSKAKTINAVKVKLGTAPVSKIEEGKLFAAWKAAIKAAHEKAQWQAGDPKDGNTLKLVPSPKCMTKDEVNNFANYVFLGSHPQGFYYIYVSPNDMTEMKNYGYVYNQALNLPAMQLVNGNLSTTVKTLTATLQPALTTKTLISSSTLAAATLWPRFVTQNTVMNISANTAAQNIWPNMAPNSGSFEWLHRSAYSYGGIDRMGPDSSQVAHNLVLGTYEANTTMIRHEEYLKRFVRYTKTGDFKLFLFTTLNTQTAWGNNTWSWLIKDLIYEWEFLLFETLGYVVGKRHIFPVLSRQIPTRFEFDMDEKFDDLWMSETDAGSDQEYFKIAMLLYLAGGAAIRPLTWTT